MIARNTILGAFGLFVTLTSAADSCASEYIVERGMDANFYPYAFQDDRFQTDPDFFTSGYRSGNRLEERIGNERINFDIDINPNIISRRDIYSYFTTVSNFSLALQGFFCPTQTGYHNFTLEADDGAVLTIGSPGSCCADVLENFTGQSIGARSDTPGSGSFYLEADKVYPIKIVYVNRNGRAALNVAYTLPDGGVVNEIGSQVFRFEENCDLPSSSSSLAPLTETVTVTVSGVADSILDSSSTSDSSSVLTSSSSDDVVSLSSEPSASSAISQSTNASESSISTVNSNAGVSEFVPSDSSSEVTSEVTSETTSETASEIISSGATSKITSSLVTSEIASSETTSSEVIVSEVTKSVSSFSESVSSELSSAEVTSSSQISTVAATSSNLSELSEVVILSTSSEVSLSFKSETSSSTSSEAPTSTPSIISLESTSETVAPSSSEIFYNSTSIESFITAELSASSMTSNFSESPLSSTTEIVAPQDEVSYTTETRTIVVTTCNATDACGSSTKTFTTTYCPENSDEDISSTTETSSSDASVSHTSKSSDDTTVTLTVTHDTTGTLNSEVVKSSKVEIEEFTTQINPTTLNSITSSETDTEDGSSTITVTLASSVSTYEGGSSTQSFFAAVLLAPLLAIFV